MSAKNFKRFKRTQEWCRESRRARSKHLSLSKFLVDTDDSLEELVRLDRNIDVSMLTHLDYQVYDEPYQSSRFTKILKKAKNLNSLTLYFESDAGRLKLNTLFQAVGQLKKLKSLKVVYKPFNSEASGILHNLMRVLQKLSTLEKLRLKFSGMNTDKLCLIPRRLSCYNLIKLSLSFQFITSKIDAWLASFGQAVGKALYKNLADPKTMYLTISKNNCRGLSPLGISKFLSNFDKIHLTNYVSLKFRTNFTYEEPDPVFHKTLGDLFLMFVKRQAKFKLNLLGISNQDLPQGLAGFATKGQNLPLNTLRLKIYDNWTTNELEKVMKCVTLFQPKKEFYIDFPFSVRNQKEEDDYDHEYDEDEEDEIEEEEDDGHVLDLVLAPMLSKIPKTTLVHLDFRDSVFDASDYELLHEILENIHKPISYLNLMLPRENIENDYCPDMDENEMALAMINMVCSMYNVTTCQININELNLGYFDVLKEDFKINEHSTLERLVFQMDDTNMKPKTLIRILKIFKDLPKLKKIDVVCSEPVYQACKSVESLKAKNGKIVLCNFTT